MGKIIINDDPLDFAYSRAIVAASGPSLSNEQVYSIQKLKQKWNEFLLITVNDTYKLFYDVLDIVYCADLSWLKMNESDLRTKIDRSLTESRIVMPDRPNIREYNSSVDLTLVTCHNYQGLHKEPGSINCGRNSGFQALHLARNLGAKEIILVGFDMGIDPETKKEHWFGSHPNGLRSPASEFSSFIEHFSILASDLEKEGTKVWNCTGPNSRLNGIFPSTFLESVFIRWQLQQRREKK
jgi:hypothetical protein